MNEEEIKKYQIVKFVFKEYVDHPFLGSIYEQEIVAEIESISKEEAVKLAKLHYPNLDFEVKES